MDNNAPSDLHSIIRLSLHSSIDLAQTLETSRLPRSSDDHIKKIIAAILWHRKFLLSYYAIIGAVILITCGHRIYHGLTRKPKKPIGDGTDTPDSSATVVSSATSTIEDTPIPSSKAGNKSPVANTPLLPRDATRPSPYPRLFDRLKSVLIYQPGPVWALTSPSNVLPDNGTSISVLSFLGINIFYLLFKTPLSIPWIFILADRAGLLFVVNLPILYILAAKNNQPLEILTGWSYESLNLFHRRLGESMIVLSIIHVVGMFIVWYTILHQRGYSLTHFLSRPVVFLGIAALFSYFAIYVTSVGWFRRLYYETFLGLHIFFQIAALSFLYLHYPTARPFVAATILIWAVDRLLWRISLSARKYIASIKIAPDAHTVLIHCDVNLRRKVFGTHAGVHQGWLPGQHVFLTVPSMGFKYRFQSHPFTIASPAPPMNANVESWPLQLVIRSMGGFSLDLLKYARQHQQCEIILEGPHGGTEVLQAAHRADRICFIAGGSGIAVTYPLAWDICVEDVMKHNSLVGIREENHNRSSIVGPVQQGGSLAPTSQYAHIWVRQEKCHQNWLTLFPRASSLKKGSSFPALPVIASEYETRDDVTDIITHSFDTISPEGRPDITIELWSWVTGNSAARSSSSQTKSYDTFGVVKKHDDPTFQREEICIIVSGPDGMVRDVRNACAKLIRDGWNIQVWMEKFGW